MGTNSTNVVIENVIAGYNGRPVLKKLCLNLYKGEICCIIGEEGAGKSTLLKVISQQLSYTGKIKFNGIDLSKVSTAGLVKAGIDFIMQGGNILKGFTVEEHILLALSGKIKDERNIIWKDLEQTFSQLIALKKQVAGRLSGGERMILSIACLLATDADFLILDEPTAGLAPETCKVIRDFLLRIKNERCKTILMMEHNYDFAFDVSDSVVTLKHGTLSEKYSSHVFHQSNFIESKLYDVINS